MSGSSNLIRKPQSFTCPICGKDFDSDQTLQVHKNKEHSTTPERPAGVG